MNKRQKGQIYEEKAVDYLKDMGYKVLDRNVYTKFGELDLVAMDQETLVFIEVKYRSNGAYGHPAESVNYHKQKHIINSSKWYMMVKGYSQVNVRYDVCGWHQGQIKYYKGAFSYGS